MDAFKKFAPTILKVYRSDKEGFWSAILAPFLSDQFSVRNKINQYRVGFVLLNAMRGLDAQSSKVLNDFSELLGFDITTWKSNRPSYLKDAYVVFAFLAVWMDENGLTDLVERFDEIFVAGVYAVAGYGILDANVDSDSPSPVEILTANALIAEYEARALRIFGVTPVNLEIMHQMRTLFIQAEIREKARRWKESPYSLTRPEGLGDKGANAVTPFMLCMERLGRADQIEDYWRVFLLFGAAIQMIDDWSDLESDLSVGHYSYVTLGYESLIANRDYQAAAGALRDNSAHVLETYATAKAMIDEARTILAKLGDVHLVRLVDVTEMRLNSFFRKEMFLTI